MTHLSIEQIEAYEEGKKKRALKRMYDCWMRVNADLKHLESRNITMIDYCNRVNGAMTKCYKDVEGILEDER